jgi:16S rRNA processing protein RimM
MVNPSDSQPLPGSEGSADSSAEPRFLVVGRVTKPHGVRGEMRVAPMADDATRFGRLERVYLDEEGSRWANVESARIHKGLALLKLEGYDSREDVDALREAWLFVAAEDADPLGQGEYYLYQLIGLTVQDEDGHLLGELVEVIETGANNVFVVEGEDGQLLLPDIPDVVQEIDFSTGAMTVRLLPGM